MRPRYTIECLPVLIGTNLLKSLHDALWGLYTSSNAHSPAHVTSNSGYNWGTTHLRLLRKKCSIPSTAALHTGQTKWEHGVVGSNTRLHHFIPNVSSNPASMFLPRLVWVTGLDSTASVLVSEGWTLTCRNGIRPHQRHASMALRNKPLIILS